MATAQDLIQDALEMIGIYGPGQAINAADANRGLSTLNDMLDSWSNESLSCFAILEQSVTLIPGKAQYTIGMVGTPDIMATRPIRLITGPGRAYITDNNQNIYGVDVITRAQWNQRGSRNTNSNFPDVLWYDPEFPLGILNFDPIPNIGYTAYWDSYLQISDFASLTTVLSLPPGYKLAITSNLALELKPYYASAQIDPLVLKKAAESKANIKRSNIRQDVAVYDPEIISRAPGIYNIYNDGYRR